MKSQILRLLVAAASLLRQPLSNAGRIETERSVSYCELLRLYTVERLTRSSIFVAAVTLRRKLSKVHLNVWTMPPPLPPPRRDKITS